MARYGRTTRDLRSFNSLRETRRIRNYSLGQSLLVQNSSRAVSSGSRPSIQWWRILPRSGAWSQVLCPRQWLTTGEKFCLPIPFRRVLLMHDLAVAAVREEIDDIQAKDEQRKADASSEAAPETYASAASLREEYAGDGGQCGGDRCGSARNVCSDSPRSRYRASAGVSNFHQ